MTSNSTAETKPSSAILNPLSTHQYSPAESPDSTKRRSCVSLGNNSSNSKSSSNLTGSTKSDQGKFGLNPMVNQVIKVSQEAVERFFLFFFFFFSFLFLSFPLHRLMKINSTGTIIVYATIATVLEGRQESTAQ